MKLKINNFKKQYSNQLVIMPNIETTKRILVLKGENGSGKSTILKAIQGIVSYEGTISLNGSTSYMNERIIFPKDSTVKEIIYALSSLESNSIITTRNLIDHFDLNCKMNAMIYTLSKGMKMKLQLICAFLIERDIYILDEPFSGLDDASVDRLVAYIENSKKSFIIATHIDIQFKDDYQVVNV